MNQGQQVKAIVNDGFDNSEGEFYYFGKIDKTHYVMDLLNYDAMTNGDNFELLAAITIFD